MKPDWAPTELAAEIGDFLDDASSGPWRPEPDLDRRRDTIWLTNDGGDSLQVDEDTVAMLVNVLSLIRAGLTAHERPDAGT